MLIGRQTVRCSNLEEPDKKLSVAPPQVEYCDESHSPTAELSRPIPEEENIHTQCV